MKTLPNTSKRNSPFISIANDPEFYPSYYAPEESAFLGLFEGKWKAKREAKNSSSTDTDSNSSGNGSISLGGSGGGFFNVLGSILGGTAGLVGAAAPILPSLGIGSKSRIKETQAQALAQTKILNAQQSILDQNATNQKELAIIGGAFLLVIVVVLIALRK
ncbi:MAG: hypothetical protein JXR61_03215 [Prolixibacteraceae bacterium]|nr:hypothetical protein [Prolixibacteraceae bacterium]